VPSLQRASADAFAALVGLLSPEFVSDLFAGYEEEFSHPIRYAASVGMIWGVFIGAAVAGFACGLSVLLKLFKLNIGPFGKNNNRKS
jgi:hypothetical protein